MNDLYATINGIRTWDDYRLACVLVRQRIRAGAEVESGVILCLAAKGHGLQPTEISREFMETLGTEPGTMVR